jgi:cell fate regulator YaaT (PSP1 superfamily)
MSDPPDPKAGQWIMVKTVRGLEMGLLGGALSQEQEAKYRASCLDEPGEEQTRGPEPMLQEVEFVQSVGEEQMQEYLLRHSDEEAVLVRARQLLKVHQLQMKLVDVEYTMDRRKLFFYFTSEQRIDFRAYVRDLAREFRIRIEMRQIGVRDEARTVRGISPCGRPCCCSYWLHRFTPINIRMVKEQNLALNPTKISGICGRLMCCMAYEHLTYNNLWKSLPSPGSKIRTAQGNFVLEGVDLQSETVLIRFPEGKEVSVAIAEFPNFRDVVMNGGTWEKDVPEEPARRLLTPRLPGSLKRTPGFSARQSSSTGSGEDAARSSRFKPEKISLEEHIAERVGGHQPERRSALSEVGEEGGAGKKGRKRKGSKGPSGTGPEPPVRATGPGRGTQPLPLRPREGQTPDAALPPGTAGGRKGGEKYSGPRRRPRRSAAGQSAVQVNDPPGRSRNMNEENV